MRGRENAVAALTRTGLVYRLHSDRVRIHRLVSEITRSQLNLPPTGSTAIENDADDAGWAAQALNVLAGLFPLRPWEPATWPVCSQLTPHAAAVVDQAATTGPPAAATATVLGRLGQYLQARGEYAQARARLEGALAIEEAVYGPDHPEVASTLTNLGTVQRELGELPAARASLRRALIIFNRVFGSAHPRTVSTASLLAELDDPTPRVQEVAATGYLKRHRCSDRSVPATRSMASAGTERTDRSRDPSSTVRVWPARTRTLDSAPSSSAPVGGPLTAHTGPVLALAAVPLPDGRVLLASAGGDGTVRLWELVREDRVPRVPGYVSDTAAAGDLLGRDREAVAVADLLTARSARPPLAVGVFGQWGEGKSQFLDLVHDAVAARSSSAREDPIAHADVQQVRFNAWHHAEADLWASLVAELFAQLGAGRDPASQARQRSRLTSEVIAARGLRGELTGARARLEALRQARSGRVTVRTVWAVARAVPRWSWIWPLLAAGVAAVVLQVGTGLGWWSGLHRWVLTLPGVAALLALAPGVRQAWTASRETRQQIRQGWERLRASPEQARQQLDTAIAVAAGEVARLERELQDLTAAGQLAGLVADRAGAGAYRERLGLMTQIRQDFEVMAELLLAAARRWDSEPGGPGDPREDRSALDPAGDVLPAIDRIVLYVDDLDRCPPQRVVEVLEAVHLLLAGRPAVRGRGRRRPAVAAAVDLHPLPRPVRRRPHPAGRGVGGRAGAVPGENLPDRADPATAGRHRVPAAGRPSGRSPRRRARSAGTREPDQLAGQAAPAPAASATSPGAELIDPDPGTRTAASTPAGAAAAATTKGELRTVVRVDPLALTADEPRLMTLLGPPLITSPRAVKRLTNSYGVLAACRPRTADGDRLELSPVPDQVDGDPPATGDAGGQAYPYRAGLVLLAAVVGYPDLGPEFFTCLYRAAQADPGQAWRQWLEGQRPTPQPNPADLPGADHPRLSPRRDQRLHDLIDALQHVARAAGVAGLALPRRLDSWSDWVIPVGRLSFPTGPAVTRLMKPPAPTMQE